MRGRKGKEEREGEWEGGREGGRAGDGKLCSLLREECRRHHSPMLSKVSVFLADE